MISLDFKTKTDIQTDISRIAEILDFDIFSPKNARHSLMESAFMELVIRLRDLLYKCERKGHRINFTEDVVYKKYKDRNGKEKEVQDITDAVEYIRNAACHIDSELNLFDRKIVFSFNVAYGKGNLMSTPDKNAASDYEDDVCFFYGDQKLYLKRHIIRAFEEATKFFKPYLT